ncbi:MAG: hotdog fold thioesterase [Deltaproteobacteria bacterium]|nr:MAG: hotdog fold thioesterase [Deltaproteobacteria bacterium]
MTPQQALIHFFEERIAFNKLLGMRVSELGDGTCRISVKYRPELLGDPFRPALHGGLLSTLADTTGGLAVFSQLDFTRSRVATVDLRVDYLRPGRPEDVHCDARVVRAGNKVAVSSMVLWQGEGPEDYVVADCRGVYNVVHKELDPSSLGADH